MNLTITKLQSLSPAGEYNLRLGIIKELHPDMVATYAGRLQSCFFVYSYLKSDIKLSFSLIVIFGSAHKCLKVTPLL